MTDPRADLFLCEHWSCWLLPRACAARYRSANRKRRWGPSPMEGTYSPAAMDTYCRDCEIGREHARREDEMAKAKTKKAGAVAVQAEADPHGADAVAVRQSAGPGLRFSWLDLIGEPLVEHFLRDAEESGRRPAEHLRHVVAEYYYLESLGA